jgi:iron complex transport system substrate-binding protein
MKDKLTAVFLSIAVILGCMIGCSPGADQSKTGSSVSSSVPSTSFTDSCGREVEIPSRITKVAPSGPLAQLFLYSLCPDKLIGLSGKFSSEAKPYMDQKYFNLPVFGQFYGKNASLNIEALAAAAPQIIIDIGEKKKTEKKDMEGVQEQTGIPTIFIEATMDTMSQAYHALGKILGEESKARELSDYIDGTLKEAKQKSAAIPNEKRVKVYYGLGKSGLETNPEGSIFADVIDTVGAVNAAVIPDSSGRGGDTVSLEQILKWQPDVMIFDPGSVYGTIEKDPMWKDFTAVKNGKVYEVPEGPYNWMGRPPSINRILGVKWLGSLLYPDIYQYDMVQEAKEFYLLFYHYKLSDEQAKQLMSKSIYKAS